MATVSFAGTTRYYAGNPVPAVDGLDLEVADGEFLVLVGPSGCGKSTTLRMLAGLEGVDGGTIHIGERDVTDLPPKERDIAMVFQNYALYPHMTVGENIGFHLKIAKMAKSERESRVREAAALLGLTDYLDRKPAKLSGGQRQRVAMGRAIVRSPQVFCMDEPLSNLDAKLRVQTRTQIASLQRRLGVTTIYVTHDQVEAMTMGDRVAVLKDGLLQQCDTPIGLFGKPANLFVAGFIGSPAMNLIVGTVSGESAEVDGSAIPLTPAQRAALTSEAVVVGVRPEGWEIKAPGDGIPATVEVVEELGSDQYLYCSTSTSRVSVDGGAPEPIAVRAPGMSPWQRGEKLGLVPVPGAVHLFDAATGARLPD
ncbi:Glycerol-3-phosphate ABC transporter, ATP-binding protein UgpC [Actinokineospora spheciospongiae]|uniref:Glycerol-3-phosphate ABC transporter, ATP-binding protein UgpC n=1 Tax=Actinokineospora spheciospongiae TaxID=909613 RepID=W7IRB3_9PSEU|nr:sn-glycerol-3-phosphate ABC transporter ATP-binding protein UgpC [Actinokineospora spheciospongiae]EWC62828.1 Glycerol-3-phosphate ABC transporter, ATP-binding protein UgpC [Actinokineospora spheciospongiae]PWW62459.1 multiple sugar transport system ATP-binding protein [Actinokineospora spheciospongiae]